VGARNVRRVLRRGLGDGVVAAWAYRLRVGRDPRQARYLTRQSLRWVRTHRAYTPGYLLRYARLAVFRLRNPHVVLEGMVFLGRGVRLYARPGYGRLVVGAWVHVGDLTRLRAHEGTLRIGDRTVFGRDVSVNCYLDVEIGAASMVADWVYLCDFDHRVDAPDLPIKDQGLVKSPVRIGPGSWLGVRSSVLRGTTMGRGCVLAAHAVARGEYADGAVIAGVPGRVVRDRARAAALRSGAAGPARSPRRPTSPRRPRSPRGSSSPSSPSSSSPPGDAEAAAG
jgi:acetyltransferase-like isoleucine patch superfamily enzyme